MKPKLLLILHLPPPIHGAALMGQYIKKSKLINFSFDCHYINLAIADDLSNIGKFDIRKISIFIKLLFEIFKTARKFKPNLVYITPNSHGKALFKDLLVVLLLKILGTKKIIAHYHNKGSAGINKFFKTKVILLSERLYGDFKKYVPSKDIYILPNGIQKIGQIKVQASNEILQILFISNLIPSKGIFILLDACKILRVRGLIFKCIFAGAETKEITKKYFENIENVEYVGAVYGEQKWDLFKKSDIFVFPTFYSQECFPLVILEAMQFSLPVIAVNVGGISDIVEDGINGFLVEKQNTIATANAIATLLNDEDLRMKMGKAGHEKFEREYTLDVFEKKMTEILRQQ